MGGGGVELEVFCGGDILRKWNGCLNRHNRLAIV